MCKDKNWYGNKEVEEYFDFISKHPLTLLSIFKLEPRELKSKRKFYSDRYYKFKDIMTKKKQRKLVKFLLDRASYISFSIYSSREERTVLSNRLKKYELQSGIYKNFKEFSEIILKDKNEASGYYSIEDYVLYDENIKQFFKSITHESMLYLYTSSKDVEKINNEFGQIFNLILQDGEPQL